MMPMLPPPQAFLTPAPGIPIPAYSPLLSPAPAEIGPALPQRLSNGGQGYFQQVANQAQSQLTVMLPLGARHESEGLMLAEMLTAGSPATKAMLTQWSQQGLQVHSAHSGDKLILVVTGPTGQEAMVTQAAMQLLTRPMMTEATYHALKQDVTRNLQDTVRNPDYAVKEAVFKAAYPGGHPYATTPSDILQQLAGQRFSQLQQRLGQTLQFPEGATISMVSSQPVEAQQQAVEHGISQFGWYASPYRRGALERTPVPSVQAGIQGPFYVPQENLKYARIIHNWKAPKVNDADYPAFMLLKGILGGMNSGFFKVLRTEKGLVYGTQQEYLPYAHAADYSVSVQVDYVKINEALKAVQQVVHDISTRPLSQAELEMAKKRAILNLRSQKQSTQGVATENNSRLGLDIAPIHPDVMQAALMRVTAQDIQRVATRIFHPLHGSQVIGVSAPVAVLETHRRKSV